MFVEGLVSIATAEVVEDCFEFEEIDEVPVPVERVPVEACFEDIVMRVEGVLIAEITAFRAARYLTSNGEFLPFVAAGGYRAASVAASADASAAWES